MDVSRAPIQYFMILHRLQNQKDLILILTLMAEMKRLTIPCVGKNIE
jgi:hypothetical protein